MWCGKTSIWRIFFEKKREYKVYARVAVIAGSASIYGTYTYEIAEADSDKVKIGDCVIVPFSSGEALGYIVDLLPDNDTNIEKLKTVKAVVQTEITLDRGLFSLASRISELFIAPLPSAVRSILPGAMRGWIREEIAALTDSCGAEKCSPAERKLLEVLQKFNGCAAPNDLRMHFNGNTFSRVVSSLKKKNLVERRYVFEQPKVKAKTVRSVALSVPRGEAYAQIANFSSRNAKRSRVLQALINSPAPVPLNRLRKLAGCTDSAIKPLLQAGVLKIVEQPCDRLPGYIQLEENQWILTQEQTLALTTSLNYLNANKHHTILIHGVTASGKTEVYMRLIERVLDMGRSAIFLVPEISLTAQAMDIFKTRFGDDVAVLHSALGVGERFDEWRRLHQGRAKVALGPRSVVLAPVSNLALIVVDEEHDTSYKQLVDPRYHARELAIQRAKDSNAIVVLGSATPSLETYYRAQQGEYSLVTLSKRIENRPLPSVRIVDMRQAIAANPGSIFSGALRDAIRIRLEKKEQIIILQNRRAYASFLLCRECGHVPKCQNCAVAVRFHRGKSRLICHHCGYEESSFSICPNCGGSKISGFGIGTERVADEVAKEFSDARVLRLDRDTTSRKGSHSDIIRAFKNREADILVGTQMVAKGLDFPGVTLVGVISADTSLNMPEFRASERAYQLLAQVAGRSGRGDNPGEVIIQTFEPEHHAVICAANHDYKSFYNQELAFRRELNYPPFSFLANITASSRTESAADKIIADAFAALEEIVGNTMEILGPAPCAIPFLRGHHRRHILLKSHSAEDLRTALSTFVHSSSTLAQSLEIDVDPVAIA